MELIADRDVVSMPRIGDRAPGFRAITAKGSIYFPSEYSGKWVILISQPTHFTTVSVSAYIDLALIENEFKVLNCELIGLSGGGIHSHIALLKTIREEIEFKEMKNAGINFPLIEGASMDLSKELRVIQAEHGKTSAIGVVFFIDPDAIIRAIVHYPVYIGFNTEELKRVIIALQTADNFDTSAPSNWVSGNSTQWPIDGSYESVNVNLESKDKELIGCDCFFCTSVLIE